jgi:transcription antitermination factor NusG
MYGVPMNDVVNSACACQADESNTAGSDEMCNAEVGWYAVRTRSRQEKVASAMLKTHGIEHYLPLRSELRQWSDRKQVVEMPVFSGYLFVKVNLMTDSRFAVLKSPGVVAFVGNHSGPLPIPEREIQDIRTVLTARVEYSLCPSLNEGDRVRVIRGALAGIEGTLAICNSTSRLLVSVATIRQSLKLSVLREDVECVYGKSTEYCQSLPHHFGPAGQVEFHPCLKESTALGS